MSKPYPFPDPNNCSPNSPTVTVKPEKVLELYNRYHPDDADMQKVTSKVQSWLINKAKNDYSWDGAEFAGSECILRVNMKKFKTPDDDSPENSE
jgi:hypothetical protein